MTEESRSIIKQGCPGTASQQWEVESRESNERVQEDILNRSVRSDARPAPNVESELRQWPVQLMLVPTTAAYFKEADLAITADCVPFAYGNFHQDFLKGRPLVVGCPKLDDAQHYVDKLAEIFALNNLRSIEILVMEVPCCSGLVQITQLAKDRAGVATPIKVTTIGVRGETFGTEELDGR